jgi:hypothetical protein
MPHGPSIRSCLLPQHQVIQAAVHTASSPLSHTLFSILRSQTAAALSPDGRVPGVDKGAQVPIDFSRRSLFGIGVKTETVNDFTGNKRRSFVPRRYRCRYPKGEMITPL